MSTAYGGIFKSLADRELVIPYFRNAVQGNEWPERYQITVDSGPYYGKGDGYFHPSTHPLLTAKQLYYMFHEDYADKLVDREDLRTFQMHMVLATGTALHSVVQTQLSIAGLVNPEDIEVEYVIHEHHVRGRIDFIVHHPNGDTIPVELKTVNERGYDFLSKIRPEWDAQLSLALHATGQPYGILMVLERGGESRMREFKVPRNDKLLSEIFDKFDYVRECLALNRVPVDPCCAPGSIERDRCAAKLICKAQREACGGR